MPQRVSPPQRLKSLLADAMSPTLFELFSASIWQKMFPVPLILPYYHIVSDQAVPHVKYLYRFRSVGDFVADIDFMLRHFVPIGLLDLIEHLKRGQPLPGRPFLLTFDDGFREMHDVVAPILHAKGVPATFFLTTAFLDNKALGHNEKSSLLIEHLIHAGDPEILAAIHATLDRAAIASGDLSARLLAVTYHERSILDEIAIIAGYDFVKYLDATKPYLTGDQVQSLLKDGFTVGAHSIDHPQYKTLSLEQQLHQTRGSICELKQRFSLDYAAFAFPYSEVGVSKVLFDAVFGSGELDVSFGTRGLLADELPFHLQRFTMEKTSRRAKSIISRQYARRLWKGLNGRGVVRRTSN